MNIDFDPSIDHYKALGVDAKATADEIKKAYRKLAKQYHPDSTGGDKKKEARFKEVSAAYEILGDPKKRAQYDEIRDHLRHGGMPRGAARGATAGAGGAQVWDLSDLFAQFFSGAGQGRPGGGAVHVEIDDEGAGVWPFEPGPRPRQRRRGRQASEPPIAQKLRAADGSWLTVKGSDVHSDLRLPFHEAILGTVRDVATVAGNAKVKIPPGTSSGQKLRLRGKGVPGPTGDIGDHYVTVQIDVPRDLDDDAKRRLVELVTYLKGRSPDGQGKKSR
jgi:DnaJ-class molecular chaperone